MKKEAMEINKIYKGDCLDIMAQMPNEFVDCIVTDPPYFMPAVHYNTRKEFKRNFADLGIMDSWFKSVFKEFKRILKPNGTIYMFCDGQSYPLFFTLSNLTPCPTYRFQTLGEKNT